MPIETDQSFDMKSATEAGASGKIKQWTLDYLRVEGHNPSLASGMEFHTIFYVGPTQTNLNRLTRIAGPESTMEYPAEEEAWKKTIESYAARIREGTFPPPLIVVDFLKRPMSIADGNKRYEALRLAGLEKYWAIFCLKRNPMIYNL